MLEAVLGPRVSSGFGFLVVWLSFSWKYGAFRRYLGTSEDCLYPPVPKFPMQFGQLGEAGACEIGILARHKIRREPPIDHHAIQLTWNGEINDFELLDLMGYPPDRFYGSESPEPDATTGFLDRALCHSLGQSCSWPLHV